MATRAGSLLTGVSVYREPADRNAVLFQVGTHDWGAAHAHDALGPAPPYRIPADLAELTAACVDAGLLGLGGAGDAPAVFVDRWIATKLHEFLVVAQRHAELADAHRQAAKYWQWRAAAWSWRGRPTDVHDLLEARQHLLDAGDRDQAGSLTRAICAQLRAGGDLGQEAELIQATLDAMPSPSAGRARWLHELGAIAQTRGDLAAAEHQYRRAVKMFAEVGEAGGAARGYESLGLLAHARGDYRKAERRYQEAAAAEYRAGPGPWTEASLADLPEEAGFPGPAAVEANAPRAAAGAPTATAAPHAKVPRRPRRTRHAVLPALVLATLTATGVVARIGWRAAPAGSLSVPAASQNVAGAERTRAGRWVARQVSRSAVVACDAAMCDVLRAEGIPAGNLLLLGPGAGSDPLGSDIVVATAAVRGEFGTRLTDVYAPLVAASFGIGSARIEVRVTASDGAVGYRRALGSDQLARATAGTELIRDGRLSMAPAARRALAGGRVDSRLLMTIAALAQMRRLRVIGFGDSGPGASPAAPLRSAEVAAATPGALGPLVAFLHGQRPPYLATSISVARSGTGEPVLRLAFGDPSPLGLLLTASGSALAARTQHR